jgi:MFS family permease
MTIVDLTIVNVAPPTIGRELHFSESDLQWVVTAYALTFGGLLLLSGRAADLLGRRRILWSACRSSPVRRWPARWRRATRS